MNPDEYCSDRIVMTVNKIYSFLHVPAFKVKTADATGVGDVFHGGFIYGLLRRWELNDILVFASAIAATKCTKVGRRTGMPSPAEVKRFLSRGV